MNTKQKVEAKIRELVTELQELSFGCRVKLKTRGDLGFIIDQDFNGSVLHWNFSIKEARCLKEDYLEIIGHPIHLEHVLMAMFHSGYTPKMFVTIGDGLNIHTEVDKNYSALLWKVNKTFSEQPEEVFNLLAKVLDV